MCYLSLSQTVGPFQKYIIVSFELLSKTAPIRQYQAVSLIILDPLADYYLNGSSYLLSCSFGCLLQHEPVPLHRPILCNIVPGPGPHEDRLRADSWQGPVGLGPRREEHPGCCLL